MPVPERVVAPQLHIVTAGQPPRRTGVIAHRAVGAATVLRDGLPVVVPELAWLQLATVVTREELIIAGDYLVRRKRPLCTLESLGTLVGAAHGARGVSAARSALGLVRAGTDSPPETRMRRTLVTAGLPEPVVGFRAFHDGYFIGTPDLAYPEYRIAFEYQGAGHRTRAEFEKDIYRLELFQEADWKVIQVTARLLPQPGWLAERARRALAARGGWPRVQL